MSRVAGDIAYLLSLVAAVCGRRSDRPETYLGNQHPIQLISALERAGPSRPVDLHHQPLTDSGLEPLDSSGSCHPVKASAFCRHQRAPPVSR
jgi:hypothetical protein